MCVSFHNEPARHFEGSRTDGARDGGRRGRKACRVGEGGKRERGIVGASDCGMDGGKGGEEKVKEKERERIRRRRSD